MKSKKVVVKTTIIPNVPALLVDGLKKSIVVSDLHIGLESKLLANKIFTGKNSIGNEMSKELLKLIEKYNAQNLILLGDIKSTIKTISKIEWRDIPSFFEQLSRKTNVIVIPGNHDSNLQKLIPENITQTNPIGYETDEILFTHGHVTPSQNFSFVKKIIMGHVHPVYLKEDSVLNGMRVWISAKIKKEFIFPSQRGFLELTIVPSFNKYLYSTKKTKIYHKSISPILERIKDWESAKIVTLDGTIIGDENNVFEILT